MPVDDLPAELGPRGAKRGGDAGASRPARKERLAASHAGDVLDREVLARRLKGTLFSAN